MGLFSSDKPFLTPDTQNFIDALEARGDPPLSSLTPEEARKVLADAQANPHDMPAADINDLELPVGPTGSVSVRFVRPQGVTEKLPIILYIHGGGWVMGDKHTHERLVRELAAGSGAAVVFPEYTPSPEAQYPVPVEQVYAVLGYVAAHADQYDLDPTRIAVAGDSVGGNMAAVTALLVKERGGPRLAFQLLLYPVTDADFSTASYKTFTSGPWLTRESMRWFWDAYLPDEHRREEATASPLHAENERLRGLPPALIITGENDVLRDEGEAYARKLMAAGVPAACVRYLATQHDFLMLNALAGTMPARVALRQICGALSDALRTRPKHDPASINS